MDRLQPKMQRDMRGLEDGPHANGEGFAAGVALVEANASAFTLHSGNALETAAMRANRPMWPKSGFNESESGSLFCRCLAVRIGQP